MTLKEYTGQSETAEGLRRQGIASVILTSKEYQIVAQISNLKAIYVPAFKAIYVKESTSNVLWTMDEHGNPKSRSVFAIEGNI